MTQDLTPDTLESYASVRKVLSLLAKLRIRHEMKLREARDGERRAPELDPELEAMMPSSYRVGKGAASALQESLTNYLVHRLDEGCQEDYVSALSAFVQKIQSIASSGEFSFAKPRIIPKLKEKGGTVYRPLSAYSDLTTKIVISLVSDWFSEVFDSYFHYEMLAYRRRREYHGKMKVTSNKDAVSTIEEYRKAHEGQTIYVAECDIQKFFDIISHKVVLESFDRMTAIVKSDRPSLDVSSARSLLESFLGSYSFYADVMLKNRDEQFWEDSLGRAYDPAEDHEFKWISLKKAMQLDPMYKTQLGIPQGAALSTVLTNIVLSSVDEPVLAGEDPDRFFVRFCDDILLMHTDYDRCRELAGIYAGSLEKHGLVYHEFMDVSILRNGKRNRFEEVSYWSAKSKSPFLWGEKPEDPNSAMWIGFLGFEFSRDGQVRMRRSSVGKKVDKMLQDYNQIRFGEDEELRKRHRSRFMSMLIERPDNAVKGHNLLRSHSGITDNPYTRRQITLLQRFREKYLKKLGAVL